MEDGRAFLRARLDHVTRPEFCYRHEWSEGDLVVWDSRCVLHRATPYDTTRHKRLMQRTTVSGAPPELHPAAGPSLHEPGSPARPCGEPA